MLSARLWDFGWCVTGRARRFGGAGFIKRKLRCLVMAWIRRFLLVCCSLDSSQFVVLLSCFLIPPPFSSLYVWLSNGD